MSWTIVALQLVALLSFFVINVGVSEPNVVSGVITSIGVDSITRSEFPVLIITVSLKNGRTARMKVNRNSPLNKGDRVLAAEYKIFISSGSEYQLFEAPE